MQNGTAAELGIDLFNDKRSPEAGKRRTLVSEVRVGGNNILILKGSVLEPLEDKASRFEEIDQLFLVLPYLPEGKEPSSDEALEDKGDFRLDADDRFTLVIFQTGAQRIPISHASLEQISQARTLLTNALSSEPRLARVLKEAEGVIDEEVRRYGHFRASLAPSVREVAGVRGSVDQRYIPSEWGSLFDDLQALKAYAVSPNDPGFKQLEHADLVSHIIQTDLVTVVERFLLQHVIDAASASPMQIRLPGQEIGLFFERVSDEIIAQGLDRRRHKKAEDPYRDADILLQPAMGKEIHAITFIHQREPINGLAGGKKRQFNPYIGLQIKVGRKTVQVYRVNGGILLSHPRLRNTLRFIPTPQQSTALVI